MSKDELPAPRPFRRILLGGALLCAALGGALVTRMMMAPKDYARPRESRAIVQIVRQQPGLPDLADVIDHLCTSVGIIVPHDEGAASGSSGAAGIPASAVSADGWLVTSASGLPPLPADVVFGDGRRVAVSELRDDPVSGLAIVKAPSTAAPLVFSDQTFPRVGQFAFALATRAGTGCSAAASMIASDFLADGSSPTGYVRLQQPPEGTAAGLPLLSTDGRVLGILIDDPPGGVIPAPIASIILDELIRNSPSPSTSFGFRAIDYSLPLAARLGDLRTGAGVALVQRKSPAAKAGLQAGDIITAVNDSPVSSASELSRALDAVSSKATLSIQRHSKELKIVVRRLSG